MNCWFVKAPFRTRSWQDVLVKGIFKLYGIMQVSEKPVSINQIRLIPTLAEAGFVKQPMVMVSPLSREEFQGISEIAIVEGKG